MKTNPDSQVVVMTKEEYNSLIQKSETMEKKKYPENEKKYGKVRDVEELLGLKAQTIYLYSSTGILPHIKLRGRIYFEMDKVKNWFEGFQRATLK